MKIITELTQIWALWDWEHQAIRLFNQIDRWVKQTKKDEETMKDGSMHPGMFLSAIRSLSDSVEPASGSLQVFNPIFFTVSGSPGFFFDV